MQKCKATKIIFLLMISFSLIFSMLMPVSRVLADKAMTFGLTVAPASIVTNKSKVEIRAGIINPGSGSKSLNIDFIKEEEVLQTKQLTVQADTSEMVNYWWDARQAIGANILGVRIREGSDILFEEYRVITVIESNTKSPGFMTIAWEEPGAYNNGVYEASRKIVRDDVFDQVEDMHSLGIDTIIYTYPEFILYGTGAYYDSDLPDLLEVAVPHPLSFDLLDTMMLAAEQLGMNVIVGTGRGNDLFIPTTTNEFNNAVDLAVSVMDEIWDKYGHYESFYGWYMTHEPSYLFSTGNGDLKFFNAIVDATRHRWPDKIVMCAPTGTPQIKTDDMKNSQIDVFAFQDAVGPGYIPGQYTYDPENRIAMLDDVFQTYRTAMNKVGKHMWSDLETWEMAGPTYSDAYPALWSRVERQINIEKNYSDSLSMYAYTGFLSSPTSTVKIGGDRAVLLFEEYSEYVSEYMEDYGITENLITSKSVDITVKDLSNVLGLVPQMITVDLNCGKSIKGAVEWSISSSTDTKVELSGEIVLPGIKKSSVKGIVTLGSSNEQIIEEDESSVSESSSVSVPLSSSTVSDVSEVSTAISSEEISKEITSAVSSEYSSQENSSAEITSATPEPTAGPDDSDNEKSSGWIVIIVLIVILSGSGILIFIKRIKRSGGN